MATALTTEELNALEAAPDNVALGATPPHAGMTHTRGADQTTPGPQTLGSSPEQLLAAGAGASLDELKRGLMGQPAADNARLMTNPEARIGAALPSAVGSILAPARVIPQALYGAAVGAMKPGGVGERAGSAVVGALEQGVGQGVASGLVKGANALMGKLTRAGEVASAARPAGLDLSAGDIMDSRLLRLLEEKSLMSPSRRQGQQVGEIMTAPQGDPITKAITDAYEAAQGKVSQAAQDLDTVIAANPQLPKVIPRDTIQSLRDIAQHNASTFNNIDDSVLQGKILAMVSGNKGQIPKGMTFSEMDELRKALGPVMAKIDLQAQSGASNVTTATANRWKQLYKAVITDMENWGGSSKAGQDVMDLHNEMKDTFKSTVLPLREHPIAGKVLDNKYQRPEDLLRDITSNRNKSVVQDLYPFLDQGGKNAFDALRLAKRGAKEFVSGQPGSSWTRPLTIGAALSAPAWAPMMVKSAPVAGLAALGLGAEQGLVQGLNTRLGKAVLGGSPNIVNNPALNRALYGIPRTGATVSGLEALRQETP